MTNGNLKGKNSDRPTTFYSKFYRNLNFNSLTKCFGTTIRTITTFVTILNDSIWENSVGARICIY